jgi:hypothetical protein
MFRYLIRIEHIALHVATTFAGAQVCSSSFIVAFMTQHYRCSSISRVHKFKSVLFSIPLGHVLIHNLNS